MSKQLRSLDQITIPTPCNADWEAMAGNDQVRFCEHCHLDVTDLSSMTRPQAMRLVAQSQGRLCVRFIQRPDGRLLTRKMPEKLYRISRRVSRIAAGAFTATLSLSSTTAQTQSPSNNQPRANVELVQTNNDRETVVDEFSANISGTIKTPEGDLVNGATVVLVDRESGEERTTSSSLGQYSFQALPEGDYLLWVRKPTFRTAREVVKVAANSTVRKDVEIEKRMLYGFGGAVGSVLVEEEPLMKAVKAEDLETVRTLVFAPQKFGRIARASSYLPEAVELGNRQIVEVLLQAGGDPNSRGNGKDPALLSLSEKATPELVRDLILAGARLNARDDYGDNAVISAARSSNTAALKELIGAGAQLNATNSAGETALFLAARRNGPEALVLLLEAGINVNARNESGDTALMAMSSDGTVENFKTLLDHGADTGLVNDDGRTALLLAAENEDAQIAKLLIDMGADVNVQDSNGETALMIAASMGHDQSVILLMNSGAALDATDSDGETALMKASIKGSAECVQALLARGADPTLRDKEGKTALAHAQESSEGEIVKLLRSRGAPD